MEEKPSHFRARIFRSTHPSEKAFCWKNIYIRSRFSSIYLLCRVLFWLKPFFCNFYVFLDEVWCEKVEKTRNVFAFSWCFLCAKCISRPRNFPGQSGRTCYGFLFNFILSETSKMFSYTQENSHTALSSATLPPEYLNHCVWEATVLCPMQKLFCNLVEFVFYTKKNRYDKNACK